MCALCNMRCKHESLICDRANAFHTTPKGLDAHVTHEHSKGIQGVYMYVQGRVQQVPSICTLKHIWHVCLYSVYRVLLIKCLLSECCNINNKKHNICYIYRLWYESKNMYASPFYILMYIVYLTHFFSGVQNFKNVQYCNFS